MERVSNSVERILQNVFNTTLIKIVVETLAELYMVATYMSFFNHTFGETKHHLLGSGLLALPTLVGLLCKNANSIIELKQGVLRIVDYDFEEK